MSGRFFFGLKMTPDKKQFIEYAKDANVVPVYAELLADMQTPVSVFAKLENVAGDCFLLESAENIDNWGRYSFIGCNPKAVFTLNGFAGRLSFSDGRKDIVAEGGDNLAALSPLRTYIASRKIARLKSMPRFFGGAVGYFGYECVRLFERLPEPKGERKWDDAHFALYDDIIIFDNLRHTAKIVSCAHIDEHESPAAAYEAAVSRVGKLVKIFKSPRKPEPEHKSVGEIKMKSNMSQDRFIEMVEKAKNYIRHGEIIQVVPSQKFSTDQEIDPISAYRALRLINPSPYLFCLKMGSRHLVGSSPETLLRFGGGKAELRPIAGTRRRGADENEDMRLADELLSDEKERAEHLMLVDLGRNDLSRFCESGSVQVTDFMSVERYSHVMHLVSDISGEAKRGVDAFDALAAAFPAGTLSGAPKIRAMEIINELEPERRGPYGGAAGYLGYGGNMDLAITIRTLQIGDGVTSVQAGAGIVADSNPQSEFEETKMKARAVAKAIEAADSLDTLDVNNMGK